MLIELVLHTNRKLLRTALSLMTVAFVMCGARAFAQQLPLYATPVDIYVPALPVAVKANDGSHVVYELHFTNFSTRVIDILKLSVIDGQDGRELFTYSGDDLQSRMRRVGAAAGADARTIDAGARAVVFLDLVFRDRGAVPRALRHRMSATVRRADGTSGEETWEDDGVVPKQRAAVVVRPPIEGKRWLAMNGLSNTSSHRRTIVVVNGKARIAQRFATDWTRLSADGQAFHDDPAKNENWYAYGAAVHSVADGVVAELHDGVPENDPTAGKMAVTITLATVGGNYVVVDIGGGNFAFFAHLQPRTLRMKVGDHVRAGQVIAKLGNSGNSDAPHLHFHISDRPSPLAGEGVPYVLTGFDLLSVVPSLAVLENGTGWPASKDSVDVRQNEIPRQNAVVEFVGDKELH